MAIGAREEHMSGNKYEKTLDNWSAALVSRESRAPRAEQDRKPCRAKELRMISLLIIARGAHVSRAARGSNAPLAARFIGRFQPFAASHEQPPSREGRMSSDVTGCHMCDIAGLFIR